MTVLDFSERTVALAPGYLIHTPCLQPYTWLLYSFRNYPRGNSGNEPRKGAFLRCGIRLEYRCYRPDVSKSPILPLAAAVTALALGALPAQAATLSPGKRGEATVVAFPLLALRGQAPASVGSHVSHSSHVSGTGGHNSHVSHVSSVPAPPAADKRGTCHVPAAPAGGDHDVAEPGPSRQQHQRVACRRAARQPGGRGERQPGGGGEWQPDLDQWQR
jgi:hypothetical protein